MLSGEERGEAAAVLLSPAVQPVDDCASSSRRVAGAGGNLFTLFLTAPLLAFCRLAKVSIVNMPAVSAAASVLVMNEQALAVNEQVLSVCLSVPFAASRFLLPLLPKKSHLFLSAAEMREGRQK